MITATTETGFEFSFDIRIIEDFRMLQQIRALRKNDSAESNIDALVNIATLIIGNDQVNALTEHIAGLNDGFVPAKAMLEECSDIFKKATEQSKELKNS